MKYYIADKEVEWDEFLHELNTLAYTVVEGDGFQRLEYDGKHVAEKRISALKQSLADTDYKVLKYTEGELTEEEWTAAKAERQAWRDEINRLQQSMHQN